MQLGHSITVRTEATPLAVYERLRERNPSPYMALLAAAVHTFVCASPELFVRVEDGRAVMRPIAGTARRGFHAGAFGLIGTDAREALLGLAIRMAVHHDGAYVLRASARFVADSIPESE